MPPAVDRIWRTLASFFDAQKSIKLYFLSKLSFVIVFVVSSIETTRIQGSVSKLEENRAEQLFL